MAKLTERQQEIKRLQDEGLSPAEIGERLGITTNAVYQQLRRMPKDGRRGGRRAGSTNAAGRQSAPTPAPTPAAVAAVATPLQAIRHRKGEIEGEIRESQRRHDQAAREAKAAAADHEKLVGKRAGELKQLQAAESALSQTRSRTAAKPRRKPARKGSAARKRSTAKATQNGQNGQGNAASVPPPTPAEATAEATA